MEKTDIAEKSSGIKSRVIKAEQLKFMCGELKLDNSRDEPGVEKGDVFISTACAKTFLTKTFLSIKRRR